VQEEANNFTFDPNFKRNEEEWEKIRREILGERLEAMESEDSETHSESNLPLAKPTTEIIQETEKDLTNLRRTIYLVVMSSVDYNECCHKLLKLLIRENQQYELCQMIVECCMQERVYSRFFGLLA
jgi:pre-mRNA-splicing factor CWC22